MGINNKYYPNSVWLIDNKDKIEITAGGTVYQREKDKDGFYGQLRKLAFVESHASQSIAMRLLSGKEITLILNGNMFDSKDCIIRRLDRTVIKKAV